MKDRLIALLRWSEKYTKTDMVYLASGGFWINLNFVFVSLCSLLLSIAFANLLSKAEYGVYQYVLSIASLLVALTFSGFNTAISQSVARGYEGALRASIRMQLRWNLVPAAAALLWSGYYFWLGQSTLGIGVLCVALSLPLLNTFNSYSAYLSGKQDFKTQSLYAMGGNAAYYLCIFAGIFLIPQALPLVAINLFVTSAAAIFLYWRTVRTSNPRGENDPSTLPYARHLSVMNLLGILASQIDNILVFHFLGASELALYSIATLLPERGSSVFKAITGLALPRFANRSPAEVRDNLLLRLFLFALLLGCGVLFYAFVAPYVFHLIYPAYDSAISYSQVYALTMLGFLSYIPAAAFSAHRKIKELYVLNTAVPVVQIVLQVGGIILGGLWGLVIGKILSALLTSAVTLVLTYIPWTPDAIVLRDQAAQG